MLVKTLGLGMKDPLSKTLLQATHMMGLGGKKGGPKQAHIGPLWRHAAPKLFCCASNMLG